jgi:hypothetical protein
MPDEAAYGAGSAAGGQKKLLLNYCAISGKTHFMLERRNNFPVEALSGYLFAQESLIRHVLFMELMIIRLVELINGSPQVKINAPPAVA